ncbi:FtsB family cell division protein [Desulfobulbus oralis]|uniref:Septum formation initiator n=1 Tax=Desulfobulbus oralis TaxID=1986146 RepID=A0A2L1GMD8_9BACT|nr:septum formation initiator family protein [Desulfobulbus oralis]AVD70822.1 hypothetical protein CAY53_04440 [Desulfobulbus oralis]
MKVWTKQRRRTGRGFRRQQNVDRAAARRAFWMLAGFMGILFLAWLLFAPGGGLVSYLKAKRELAGIRQQSTELEKSNALLRQEIGRLKTDEAYLEDVARRQHGLLKKNERVYEFRKKEGR